jgi:hypothetical protein
VRRRREPERRAGISLLKRKKNKARREKRIYCDDNTEWYIKLYIHPNPKLCPVLKFRSFRRACREMQKRSCKLNCDVGIYCPELDRARMSPVEGASK